MEFFTTLEILLDLIQDMYSEVFSIRNTGNKKSCLKRVIFLTVVLIILGISAISIIIAGFALIFAIEFYSIIMLIVVIAIIAVNIFVLLVLPKHILYFQTIEDEMKYSNKNNSLRHTVLFTLQQTARDCFVLAGFEGYIGICPAVYNKCLDQFGIINVYRDNTYYKSINLSEFETDDNTIRIRRIKNNLTKTQMIFFASKNSNLDIRINDMVISKIDSKNSIGDFSLYGAIETSKTKHCETVTINGYTYKLIKCKYSKFISENEVSM